LKIQEENSVETKYLNLCGHNPRIVNGMNACWAIVSLFKILNPEEARYQI
jgi:hypothetical protein